MERWLLIDDLRDFKEGAVPEGVELTIARTSAEALSAIRESRDGFTKVFFDHDLGGDDTTRPVALHLEEMAFLGETYPIDEVIIHTSNSVGAQYLTASLERAYPLRSIFAGDIFTG